MMPRKSESPPHLGPTPGDEVIEIALLLPKKRADALMAMSRQRHETVGQILRTMIDQALAQDAARGVLMS